MDYRNSCSCEISTQERLEVFKREPDNEHQKRRSALLDFDRKEQGASNSGLLLKTRVLGGGQGKHAQEHEQEAGA